jgi:flavin-dependent dehydrogenase
VAWPRPDRVIIVGAGPSGLALAGETALAGGSWAPAAAGRLVLSDGSAARLVRR